MRTGPSAPRRTIWKELLLPAKVAAWITRLNPAAYGKKAFRGQQAHAGAVEGIFLRSTGVIVLVWALGHF
nr:unnamed protein product [Haemonchus contortus]